MKVNGKVMVVTGGGNGVGRELVLQLLDKGAYVAAIDINMKGLDETKKLSGNHMRLSLHEVNITDKEAVESLVTEVKKVHGTVDGIINNAGIIQPFIHILDMDYATIDRVMNVNFYGTLFMVKAFLPILIKRPEAHILNVSSMGGFFPVPGQSAYGASKAAVKLLTEGLKSELRDTQIGVSVVIPGGIITDIKKNSNIENSQNAEDAVGNKLLLTPQKAAELIIETIEKNKSKAYIGKDCKVMNLLNIISPTLASKLINKVLSSDKH